MSRTKESSFNKKVFICLSSFALNEGSLTADAELINSLFLLLRCLAPLERLLRQIFLLELKAFKLYASNMNPLQRNLISERFSWNEVRANLLSAQNHSIKIIYVQVGLHPMVVQLAVIQIDAVILGMSHMI